MRSLAACIKKAGKNLTREDADAIREIMAEGMTAAAAVDEYMIVMSERRSSLVNEIVAQGGRPTKLAFEGGDLTMDDISFNMNLPERQLKHQQAFAEWATSTPWPQIRAAYLAMDGSTTAEDVENGRILSVDAMRELYPPYNKDRSLSNGTHEVASALIKKLYAERLSAPAPRGERFLWLAGGTGAGKTTGLKTSRHARRAALVYDGNLAKFEAATRKIDQALEAGKIVAINYVYRDVAEAYRNGVIKRARGQWDEFGSGRSVQPAIHAITHAGSRRVIQQLREHYADNPRVMIEAVDNSNGRGNAKLTRIRDLPLVDQAEAEAIANRELEAAYENGEINDILYRHFHEGRAGEPQGGEQGRRARDGGQPEQSGAGAGALFSRSAAAQRIELEAVGDNPEGRPPAPAGEIIQPIPTHLSQEQKYAVALAMAEENKALIDPIVDSISTRLGVEIQTDIKGKESAIGKANRPEIIYGKNRPWWNLEHERDIFRFRGLLGDVRQAEYLMGMLNDMMQPVGGLIVVKSDVEKYKNKTPWGWRPLAFDLEMPNGQIAEFYMAPREMIEVSDNKGHTLYERWRLRDVYELSGREYRRMEKDRAESNGLYDEAYGHYLQRNQTSEVLDFASARKLSALAESFTSTNELSKSSTVNEKGGLSDQTPAADLYPFSPSSSTTTRPSSDSNIPIAPLYSREDGTQPAVKKEELQLALAPAIRALAGTVRVNIVQSTTDLPMDAVPTDVEGVYRGGDEVFLVADNLPTAERAKKVFAHETFGHLAMEQTPEFQDVLASVKNMLAMNNKTFTDAAAAVATTQGNLDEDTQAKEILAYMAENGIENGVMARAYAAIRLALRRMGLLDGADYTEAEIKELLVRAARDLVSGAEAKQQALAAMPLQEQLLSDPNAVADVIMLAIKEVYANAAVQDATLQIYTELNRLVDSQDPEDQQRSAELREALYKAQIAPGLAPDVMDPEALYSRAYHGTAARFDKFDINYLGTGEGNQVFGWGLYFSSIRAIGEWYKGKLSAPEFEFRGKRMTRKDAKGRVSGQVYRVTKKYAPDNAKASPGSDPGIAASSIANGLMGMVARGNGQQAIKDEVLVQVSNYQQQQKDAEIYAKEAERELGQGGPFADFHKLNAERAGGDWNAIAQKSRMMAEGWDAAYKLINDGKISYEGSQGNLYEVEIPDDEHLLHWDKALSDHPQEVQDKIKQHFPELYEGEVRAEFRAESMNGEKFYHYAGDALAERQVPGILNAMFQGFSSVLMGQASDQIASKYLRDELGIPGHSFLGTTSDGRNYVIYDDSTIEINYINDTKVQVDSLFSRAGQYLQINDKQRSQPPQIAAQASVPKDLETGMYWVLASEAGTRAFTQPKGSWEERYYTEIGRQASQRAKLPPPQAPMSNEQLALFSRAIDKKFSQELTSETPDNPAKPGKPFLVYRLASADHTTLANTNAGNAMGVAHHLARAADFSGPAPAGGFGDTVHVYAVTVDRAFGSYQLYNKGTGGTSKIVGRGYPDPFGGKARINYSFPASGFESRLLKSTPLAELESQLADETGFLDFDFSGSIKGGAFLQQSTEPQTALFSRANEAHQTRARAMSEAADRGPYPWQGAPGASVDVETLRADANRLRQQAAEARNRSGFGAGQAGLATRYESQASDMEAEADRLSKPLFARKIHSDPEIEALRAKVLTPALEDFTLKDRIRDVINRITGIEWLGIKQGIIDSAASVEELEKGLFGHLLDASASAYKAMLSTRNLGSVMAAIMHRGIPIYQNGVFTARTGRQGLIQIFEKITHHKEGNLLPLWELYAAAKRSQRLILEKNPDGTFKEKVFTQKDIDKALSLEAQYPEFKTAFMEWQKFNSQLLDLAIKTGVINGDEAKVWRQNDYVPFYRAMEEIEYMGGQGPQTGRSGIANVRSGIKRLTGSTAQIGNVFENMVMNTAYLTDAIYRNTAMQRVVAMADGVAMEKVPMAWEAIKFKDGDIARALMRAGLIVGRGSTEADMFNDGIRQVKAMTTEQKEHWSTLFRRVAPKGDNIVSVLIQGKPVYYEVQDPLLFRSLAAMGAQQWGGIMHTFRFAKRTLTKAVTIDPAFMLANFIRDTLSTAVITKGNGVEQIAGALKGLQAAWAEDPVMLDMMMAGAGGGGFYDHNPADVRRMLAKKMPAGQVNAFANSILTPRGMWRFWQKIGNASEQANRIALYRRVIAAGGTPAEAAYQARDVLNFTMAGDYNAMKFLVQTVPFLNARIQGLYRLYRGGKENPVGFAMKGLTITAATMALLLRNLEDDRFKDLPEWDKDTYWHFFIGDEHFRLPKPFEVGAIFATTFERAYMLGSGDDDIDTTIERGWRMVLDTFAFNPVPQALKPITEQYANRNMFTGNPIIGMHHKGLEPEAQYDPWTSETMREMAKLAPDSAPSWLRSPKRLEAFMRGYFGAAGMYALTASDAVTRRAFGHPSRPSRGLRNYPVITRFWRDPAPRTSKYSSQLYDMLGEADATYKTMNAYRDQHRVGEMAAMMEDGRGKLHARKFLHDVAKQVREINKNLRLVQYSNMDPETKKARIDKLNAAKIKVMSRVAAVSDIF